MLGCFLAINRATIGKVYGSRMLFRFTLIAFAGMVNIVNVLTTLQSWE
jgi:hypothetical protein